MEKELSLQETQQESFKVLLKLKEIFEQHGWKYFLAYGTLIGALRHDGFIPWDDDIDIYVPRKDYEAFVQYCIENEQSLLPFRMMDYRTNPKYIYGIGRFCNTEYRIEYNDTKDYGLGTFVDLYPIDNYIDGTKLEKRLVKLRRKIVLLGMTNYPKNGSKLKVFLRSIYVFLFRRLCKNKMPKYLKKYHQMATSLSNSDTPFAKVYWENILLKYDYQRHFEKGHYHIFNGVDLMIPDYPEEILQRIYGDFMKLPPEEDRIGHHFYSVYKNNQKS